VWKNSIYATMPVLANAGNGSVSPLAIGPLFLWHNKAVASYRSPKASPSWAGLVKTIRQTRAFAFLAGANKCARTKMA
jgi:hypothetical protein